MTGVAVANVASRTSTGRPEFYRFDGAADAERLGISAAEVPAWKRSFPLTSASDASRQPPTSWQNRDPHGEKDSRQKRPSLSQRIRENRNGRLFPGRLAIADALEEVARRIRRAE
jgi:hypothetical protein